jgi:phosphoribosylformimino-5-aminoimidazole carboxamide ribonucleotide (ProFAR) isomerase
MGRFRNVTTEVVVSVDDSKDDRFTEGWEPANKPTPAKRTRKTTSAKAED